MNEIALQTGGQIEQSMPPGARALGVRVKPALRLAMGYRDDERRGAPVKTDYLIAKFGPENRDRAAALKFNEVYGEKPKSVEIRVPAELRQALTIQYKAWGGGGDDEGGGVLKAIGHTNFALEDYVGGPDVLTVWRPDGEVEEIEIKGLDDYEALLAHGLAHKKTKNGVETIISDLDLYTNFRFGIPSVLGWGSFAEITSKGKATTDNLWTKLRGIYGVFGARASFAVRPLLVIRPDTARPVIEKDGEKRRIKSRIYVLDLVIPEAEDEMFDRLRDHAALMGSPATAVYGAPAAALVQGSGEKGTDGNGSHSPEAAAPGMNAAPTGGDAPAAEASSSEVLEGDIVGEPVDGPEQTSFTTPAPNAETEALMQAGREAGLVMVTFGKKHPNRTIAEIADDDPSYLEWLVEKFEPKTAGAIKVVEAARVYVATFFGGES